MRVGLEEQTDLTTHCWPKNPEQGKPGIEPFLDCHTAHCTISLLLLVVVNTAPLLPRDSPLFASFPPTRCVHGDTRKAQAAIATKLGTCTGANPAAPPPTHTHTHTHRGRKRTRTYPKMTTLNKRKGEKEKEFPNNPKQIKEKEKKKKNFLTTLNK